MPESEGGRPRAATCEDWDEDAQTTLPDSQTSANVSAKRSQQDLDLRQREKNDFQADGGDSGYASRAATIASGSTASNRRKMPELKVDIAGIRERERNPYLYSKSAAPKPTIRRQSSSQSKEPSPEKRPPKVKDDPVERSRADYYAKQFEMKHASRATPPPPSPAKTGVSKGTKDDQGLPVKSRRPSTNQQPRPVSMLQANAPYPVQYAMHPAYGPAPIPTSGYATPVTPSMPYSPMPFSYAQPTALPTPVYAIYQPMHAYFDQLPEPLSARPSRNPSPVRRTGGYGEPVVRHNHADSGMGSLERIPSKETRAMFASHKSSHNVEFDRANMPPPPRPQQPDVEPMRRPSTRRAKTYHPQEPTVRERIVVEPDHYPDRYESDDDHDYRPVRAAPPTTNRERRESASRPPSSFRPLAHAEPRERPSPRKSVSYSAGTTVTKVATTTPHFAPRRMTVPLEQKEAEAEDYQTKRNAVASGLTVEALRKLDQRTSSSKSETGSNFSHQSSSKDSSGRARSQTAGTKTNITFAGGLSMTIPKNYDGRPLSINVGGVIVSVANEGKENERPREQKRIERAPSVASRNSKKSVASSAVSSRGKECGRELPPPASRRPSQLEERGPSVRSSRQASRAPSLTRRSTDYSSQRQSVDFSRDYDDFYAA